MKAIKTISNYDLARIAKDAAIEQHPRLKNWRRAIPARGPVKLGAYYTERIDYKGRFKGYTGGAYYPQYTSYLICDNKGAVYTYGFSGDLHTRKLRAPAGTEWDHDGSLVLCSDYNVEWHPTAEDLLARDFGRRVKTALREAKARRAEAVKRQQEQDRLAAIYNSAMDSAYVTLEDSRRAGNCLEGSLRFAEERLGLCREDVIQGRWLLSVPAPVLLRTHDPAAERAVRCAVERETTISI